MFGDQIAIDVVSADGGAKRVEFVEDVDFGEVIIFGDEIVEGIVRVGGITIGRELRKIVIRIELLFAVGFGRDEVAFGVISGSMQEIGRQEGTFLAAERVGMSDLADVADELF